MSKYCDNCPRLDPKENEQTNPHIPHTCTCNNRRMILKHAGMHPHIPTPDNCPLIESNMSENPREDINDEPNPGSINKDVEYIASCLEKGVLPDLSKLSGQGLSKTKYE